MHRITATIAAIVLFASANLVAQQFNPLHQLFSSNPQIGYSDEMRKLVYNFDTLFAGVSRTRLDRFQTLVSAFKAKIFADISPVITVSRSHNSITLHFKSASYTIDAVDTLSLSELILKVDSLLALYFSTQTALQLQSLLSPETTKHIQDIAKVFNDQIQISLNTVKTTETSQGAVGSFKDMASSLAHLASQRLRERILSTVLTNRPDFDPDSKSDWADLFKTDPTPADIETIVGQLEIQAATGSAIERKLYAMSILSDLVGGSTLPEPIWSAIATILHDEDATFDLNDTVLRRALLAQEPSQPMRQWLYLLLQSAGVNDVDEKLWQAAIKTHLMRPGPVLTSITLAGAIQSAASEIRSALTTGMVAAVETIQEALAYAPCAALQAIPGAYASRANGALRGGLEGSWRIHDNVHVGLYLDGEYFPGADTIPRATGALHLRIAPYRPDWFPLPIKGDLLLGGTGSSRDGKPVYAGEFGVGLGARLGESLIVDLSGFKSFTPEPEPQAWSIAAGFRGASPASPSIIIGMSRSAGPITPLLQASYDILF